MKTHQEIIKEITELVKKSDENGVRIDSIEFSYLNMNDGRSVLIDTNVKSNHKN